MDCIPASSFVDRKAIGICIVMDLLRVQFLLLIFIACWEYVGANDKKKNKNKGKGSVPPSNTQMLTHPTDASPGGVGKSDSNSSLVSSDASSRPPVAGEMNGTEEDIGGNNFEVTEDIPVTLLETTSTGISDTQPVVEGVENISDKSAVLSGLIGDNTLEVVYTDPPSENDLESNRTEDQTGDSLKGSDEEVVEDSHIEENDQPEIAVVEEIIVGEEESENQKPILEGETNGTAPELNDEEDIFADSEDEVETPGDSSLTGGDKNHAAPPPHALSMSIGGLRINGITEHHERQRSASLPNMHAADSSVKRLRTYSTGSTEYTKATEDELQEVELAAELKKSTEDGWEILSDEETGDDEEFDDGEEFSESPRNSSHDMMSMSWYDITQDFTQEELGSLRQLQDIIGAKEYNDWMRQQRLSRRMGKEIVEAAKKFIEGYNLLVEHAGPPIEKVTEAVTEVIVETVTTTGVVVHNFGEDLLDSITALPYKQWGWALWVATQVTGVAFLDASCHVVNAIAETPLAQRAALNAGIVKTNAKLWFYELVNNMLQNSIDYLQNTQSKVVPKIKRNQKRLLRMKNQAVPRSNRKLFNPGEKIDEELSDNEESMTVSETPSRKNLRQQKTKIIPQDNEESNDSDDTEDYSSENQQQQQGEEFSESEEEG